MGTQSISITRNQYENNILDLEKKYFSLLLDIVQSDGFKQDLLLIEKEMFVRAGKSPKFFETFRKSNSRFSSIHNIL